VKTQEKIKVNGILLQNDQDRMIDENVEAVLSKVDKQLRRWSVRHLSILGKILIAKTYGISQITFLMQSVVLSEAHFKKFNNLIYKFLWNKHYLAAKAPERVKREIVNCPIKYGGFGMLDLTKLDRALKIKGIGRLATTNHPFLKKIKDSTDFSNFFFIPMRTACERFSVEGIKNLCELRKRIFSLRTRGKTKLGHLTRLELLRLFRHIDREIFPQLEKAKSIQVDQNVNGLELLIPYKSCLADIKKLSSKSIRECLTVIDPICLPKFGAILTPNECLNWGESLRRVTSVKHKSILLRVAHGDVYSKAKLFRFGLINSPDCTQCGQPEDLQHKIFMCPYSNRIWEIATNLTDRIKPVQQITNDPIENRILGASTNSSPLILTIHAEILLRLLGLRDDDNYRLTPKHLVKLSIMSIMKRERSLETKSQCGDLLTLL